MNVCWYIVFPLPPVSTISKLALNKALKDKEDAVWVYANVYDPMDGETPLNWWHDYLAK